MTPFQKKRAEWLEKAGRELDRKSFPPPPTPLEALKARQDYGFCVFCGNHLSDFSRLTCLDLGCLAKLRAVRKASNDETYRRRKRASLLAQNTERAFPVPAVPLKPAFRRKPDNSRLTSFAESFRTEGET